MTGYSAEELLNGEQIKLTYPDDWQRDEEVRAPVLRGELNTWIIEKRLLRKNGEVIWVLVNGNLIRDSSGHPFCTVAVIQDITAGKQAERQLTRDLDAMTRLQKLGALSAQGGNLEPVLAEIVDAAIAISGADFGNTQLLDPANGDLRIAAQRGFPQWWIEFWNSVAKGKGVCGTALERGERVIVEDVEQSPIFVGTPALDIQRKAGVRAVQSTPLVSRSGKTVGMFSTHYRTPGRPDDRALRLLDLLDRQAADIIENAQADAALRESEERFRALNETSPVGVGVSSVDGVLLYTNPAYDLILGYSRGELLGKKAFDLYLNPNDRTSWLKAMKEGGAVRNVEIRLKRKDGIPVWVSINTSDISYGGKQAVMGTIQDITARKQAEEALAAANERTSWLASFPEENPNPVMRVAAGGGILYCNPAAKKLMGWDYEVGQSLTDPLLKVFKKAMASGTEVQEDVALGNRAYAVSVAPIFGGSHANVYGRDITERKRAEEQLRESEMRYRTLFDSMTEGFALHEILTDEQGRPCDYRFLDVNPAFEQLTGLKRDGLLGKCVLEVLPGTEAYWIENYGKVALTGEPMHFENFAASLNRWYEVFAYRPAPCHFAAVFTDISARKRAEEAVAAAHRQIQSIIDNTPALVYAFDLEKRFVMANTALAELLNSTPEQIIGKRRHEFMPLEDAGWHEANDHRVIETGRALEFEEYSRLKDRSITWLTTKFPLRDAQGRIYGVAGISADITERKRAEEAVRKAKDELEVRVQERTEDLAKSQHRLQHLSSQLLLAQEKERKRVAVELHDGLLSELAAMKYLVEGRLKLVQEGKFADPQGLKRVADILAMVIKEARGIMNNLHPSVLDELGLLSAISWLTGEYEKSYPNIKVQKRFEVSEKDVEESVRIVIFRVLQEALNNFAKHGKGDRVELSLVKSDSTFEFAIQDNGQGFDVENAPKGLGLESMRERVELSGGKFEIESILSEGTTIRASWKTA